MRFIGICLMGFGGLLVLAFFSVKGRNFGESTEIFFLGLLGVGACYVGWKLFWLKHERQKKAERELESLPQLKEADYKHVFDTSAIALKKSKETLFLADGKNQKTYSFSDVRKWSYSVMSGGGFVGGMTMTGGLAGVANNAQVIGANRRAQQQNIADSGLFIEVRDIDFPKWKIRFEHKNIEPQVLRWMEILRQNINENHSN